MSDVVAEFQRVFYPTSIAVVGASSSPFKHGYRSVQSSLDIGFDGNVYPVNPREETICGLKTYPTLTDVPDPVDVAIIVVPARHVSGIMRECAAKGVAGTVIITGGFGETEHEDGPRLQAEITDIANEAGIKIIGPNTFGMVNLHGGVNASFTPVFSKAKRGGVSIVSQSGGICHIMAFQAIDEGIGMGKVVGLGNRCNVGFGEMIRYLAEDDETETVVLYIEGLDDPRPLFEEARKIAGRKPIIGYKVGRTEAIEKAAVSHTGSMAGSYHLYQAAFKQAGIVPADDCVELMDIAKAVTLAPPLKGNRVAVISFQAGPGIVLTDAVADSGLVMAEFSSETVEKLNSLWPHLTIRSNPVDLAFMEGMETLGKILAAVLDDENVDAAIVFYLDVAALFGKALSDSLLEAMEGRGKPVFICANAPSSLWAEDYAKQVQDFASQGIPVYPLPERTVKALRGLARYGKVVQHFAE